MKINVMFVLISAFLLTACDTQRTYQCSDQPVDTVMQWLHKGKQQYAVVDDVSIRNAALLDVLEKGDIKLCTSHVTDMSSLFAGRDKFNADIRDWDTSSVTNMRGMFHSASSFNQPLGRWDTANVTDMGAMFFLASSYNQSIESWNTASVTDMSAMFFYASSFNQPLGRWNTSNVKKMNSMFNGASSFNQDLSSWNVESVENFESFKLAAFLKESPFWEEYLPRFNQN